MLSVAMVQAQTFNKPDFLNRVFSSSRLKGANPGCAFTPSVVLSNVSLKGWSSFRVCNTVEMHLCLASYSSNDFKLLQWVSVCCGHCSFTLASPASSSRAASEMLMSCLHWELSLWVTRWMLRTNRPAAVSGRARPYNTRKYQTPQRIEQSRIQAT